MYKTEKQQIKLIQYKCYSIANALHKQLHLLLMSTGQVKQLSYYSNTISIMYKAITVNSHFILPEITT